MGSLSRVEVLQQSASICEVLSALFCVLHHHHESLPACTLAALTVAAGSARPKLSNWNTVWQHWKKVNSSPVKSPARTQYNNGGLKPCLKLGFSVFFSAYRRRKEFKLRSDCLGRQAFYNY
jgi:hypothetical protein